MRRALALFAAGVTLVASACTKQNEKKDELSDALYRTETMPRTFTYTDERGADSLVARVLVEDDYRFRIDARAGTRAISEVVHDDARALRFTGKAGGTAGAAAPFGTIFATLEGLGETARADFARLGWVVDAKAANGLFAEESAKAVDPGDELDDVLEVLKYVRRSMGEAASVVGFNPESPDYRPRFDAFPHPADGVLRYDVVPPALTPRDPTTTSGRGQQLPGPRYFRRMAVYVRDGAVIEVRERISVEDMLNDPRSRLAARIGDYGITLPADASTAEQAALLVRTLNETALRLGQPAVVVRDLDVRFDDLGVRKPVQLPKDAKRGSLAGVRNNSQILYETPG